MSLATPPRHSRTRSSNLVSLVLALSVTGCLGSHAPSSAPVAGKTTGDALKTTPLLATTAPQPAVAASGAPGVPGAGALTGKIAIFITPIAGASSPIVSNNGGSIIANNGGGIVSDNGGGLIGNNGGSVIANNGAGLVGATQRRLLGIASQHQEAALAGAIVTAEDASGKPLHDAKGAPLTCTSDGVGNYNLVLPAGVHTAVLHVAVAQGGVLSGGQLSAIAVVAAGVRTQAISTATTLGTDYVLTQFVKGDQAKLDLLPAAETDKLAANMQAASELIGRPPSYAPADAVKLAGDLSSQAPGVASTLSEIHDLLLGELQLGDGRQASSVAVYGPGGLFLDGTGNLLFFESSYGRIRELAADGTISTYADSVRGKIHRNFPAFSDAVRAPDGSLYIAAGGEVVHMALDGSVTALAGFGLADQGVAVVLGATAAAAPTAAQAVNPAFIGLAPDGTLYIGEFKVALPNTSVRLLKLPPGGSLQTVAPAGWTPGAAILGVRVGTDGSVFVLSGSSATTSGRLDRLMPDGSVRTLATDLSTGGGYGCLALGPDGTAYVGEPAAYRITALSPTGTRTIFAGHGGPDSTTRLTNPNSIVVRADGTLDVADGYSNLIYEITPAGGFQVIAGTAIADAVSAGDLPLDAPSAAAFDEQGRLLVSEHGGFRLVRYDGTSVATIAGGGTAGDGGDGGPAVAAQLSYPFGVATRNGEIYIGEAGSSRLRAIAPDGTMSTVISNASQPGLLAAAFPAGTRLPANMAAVHPDFVAIAPDGTPYWSSTDLHQIFRLAKDGFVETVAGVAEAANSQGTFSVGPDEEQPQPALTATLSAPRQLTFDKAGNLYVADAGDLLVRKITGLDGANPQISKVAGTSSYASVSSSDPTDNGFASALLIPSGLALAPDGTLYVSELGTASLPLFTEFADNTLASLTASFGTNYARVRKFTPDGHASVIAGPGGKLFTDPQAPDGLVLPLALALAADGRLAIVDSASNLVHILPAGSF